jgi:hypothetical protein
MVSAFAPLQPRTHRSHPRELFSKAKVSDKPSRLDIEEAAGQRSTVEHIAERDAIQGFTSKTEEECTKYACMASDPEMQKTLNEITKERPYPLFLLEKAAKIVGDILRRPVEDNAAVNGATSGAKTKERLVVLGTGWGAAALLSDIDNERYDVTVISPRNYFLFTPMLAGAGVGTVDSRSITQPIREVRT